MTIDKRRNFSSGERRYIFRKYNGICQMCGLVMSIRDKWEVDHIIPHNKEGETSIRNAQLLCRVCNQEKSNKNMSLNDWNVPLRNWQLRAVQRFTELYETYKGSDDPARRSMLLNAFPGAGKTLYSIRIIHDWLSRNHSKPPFVLVLVPKGPLTEQFGKDAGQFGIRLSYQFDARKKHKGYKRGIHGLVLTYSRTDYHRDWLKSFAERYALLVVMDEVHHVAGLHATKEESKAWVTL